MTQGQPNGKFEGINQQRRPEVPSVPSKELPEELREELEKLREAQEREDRRNAERRKRLVGAGPQLVAYYAKKAELSLVLAEIRQLQKTGIEEIIANSGSLIERKRALEKEKQAVEAEQNENNRWIEELYSLTRGREKLAPEVIEAVNKANKKRKEIEDRLRELTAELKKIELPVTEDQIQRYQELLERKASLENELNNIASIPEVRELLNIENEIKNRIVNEALKGAPEHPVAKEVLTEVAQRFLAEEFEIRGFNKIANPEEREKAMREFAEGVISTASLEPNSYLALNQSALKTSQNVGELLRWLVGKTQTELVILLKLASKIDESSTKVKDLVSEKSGEGGEGEELINYTYRHLGSLNLLFAKVSGLRLYEDTVFNGAFFNQSEIWFKGARKLLSSREFKGRIGVLGGGVQWGPLIPTMAREEWRESILKAEFQENKRQAENKAREMAQEERRQLQDSIKRYEEGINRLNQRLSSELSRLEKERTIIEAAAREEKIYDLDSAYLKLQEVNESIRRLEQDLSRWQGEFKTTSKIRIFRRRDIKELISEINQTIYTNKAQENRLRELINAYNLVDTMQKPIQQEIEEAREKLSQARNRLEQLNKVYPQQ
jgi:chromosome segregation ATPase